MVNQQIITEHLPNAKHLSPTVGLPTKHDEETGKIQRLLEILEPWYLWEAKGEELIVEYLKVSEFASGH